MRSVVITFFDSMYEYLPQCHAAFAPSEYGVMAALFAGGLAGSVTHCAGMCGPFVLAQVSGFDVPWTQRILLPYHLGRATTYTLLGTLVSLLTMHALRLPAWAVTSHVLLALAGTVFFASALSSVFPQFTFGMCAAPSSLMARVAALLPRHSLLSGYTLGILLGFLPCGLVYAALLAAAATGNPLKAAAGMMAFALGTTPALVAISLGGHALLPRRQAWAKAFSTALMAFNGMTLFILAGKGFV